MRKIEKYYLSQVLSFWMIISTVIVGVQSLLTGAKEYQKISESYTLELWSKYMVSDALGLFIEIAPITLFLSIVITHWQWSLKSLWISAALSGQTGGSWVRASIYLILITSSLLLSMRYYIWPPIAHQANLERLVALGRLKEGQKSHDLESLGSYFFYYDSLGSLSLFDPSQNEIIEGREKPSIIAAQEAQIELKKDLQIGLSTVPMSKKLLYRKEALDTQRKILRGALLKDLLYPIVIIFSVILGWRNSPIQWNNRKITCSPVKVTVSLVAFYLCLKIIPLATLFFKPSSVIWGAAACLMGALAIPPAKQV